MVGSNPGDDDEVLESCDDPVPLDESAAIKSPMVPRLAKPLKPPPQLEAEVPVLPDDIPLAPSESGSTS
jgi:hypothetical protein